MDVLALVDLHELERITEDKREAIQLAPRAAPSTTVWKSSISPATFSSSRILTHSW